MTPERFRQVESLYHAVLEQPQERRPAFLAQACAGDEALRRKIVLLVKAHEQAGNFLSQPATPGPLGLERSPEPGTQFGPYEIIASIGKGGMGDVYRAKDTRLGREIAIKVLPSQFSSDLERLKYFEQEARAASALNHPNIVTIHDIGQSEFGSYIAMELVDGMTLRNILASGHMPPKTILSVAAQVADGLAKAHAAGIVHRDLKPENLMITKDGLPKVLDFGIAKVAQPAAGSESGLSAISGPSELDAIPGTPGYMSPEQARGGSIDFRSDQFSFGAILREMATGERAFRSGTGGETVSATIHGDPEPIGVLDPDVYPALQAIIDRCLAKNAEDRYASTADLARELHTLRDHFSGISAGKSIPPVAEPRWRRLAGLALGIALLSTLIGSFISGRGVDNPALSLEQLTYIGNNFTAARFAADGQSIIYAANSEGKRPEVFTMPLLTREARSLGLMNSGVWSVSPSGMMAIASDCRFNWSECIGIPTLVSLAGGPPQEILPNPIHAADWDPGGSQLAIARLDGMDRLEYPIGAVLYETRGWIGDVRVSPRGDWIAFHDYSTRGSTAGSVSVIRAEPGRSPRTLSAGWSSLLGLAWSPDGNEVWFTGSKGRAGPDSLHAVSLEGREREVDNFTTNAQIMDISRQGRVLLRLGAARAEIVGRAPGDAKDHNLSYREYSTTVALSADRKLVLFYEWSGGVDGITTAFLRRTAKKASAIGGELVHAMPTRHGT
jgi:serine/threonine protein kinase